MPENPEILKNFLATSFVIDANDGQEEMDRFFGFVIAPDNETPNTPEKEISDIYGKNDTWTIYWYICGTNLETESQSATNDIKEMEQVKLSPNVKVLIQTGTTSKWHHEIIAKSGNGRYLYDNKGWKRISKSNSNMYESETLKSFLEYGEKNYPADHKILIFWDHGGVGGVCANAEGNWESLSLNDIRSTLEKVYGKAPKKTPSNLDGWYYTEWLNELVAHPESNGAILGQKICSGSMADCYRHKNSSESTFSVVDISKLDKLHVAHKNFFTEALSRSNSRKFSTNFNSIATNIRDFDKSYIDLKLLAEGSKNLMPGTADELISAINDVVVGQPENGTLYKESGGLSTYYPYNKKWYSEYKAQNSALPEQKSFYDIMLEMNSNNSSTGSDDSDNSNAPRSQKSAISPRLPLMNVPVHIDENKHIYTQLTPEQLEYVSSVRCMVLPSVQFANEEMGVKDKGIVVLGNDVDFKGDWQNGIFRDNFRNVWASIDGHLIFMSVTFSNNEYTIYEVPIKLNGEIRTFEISYNYNEKKYSLLGARQKMQRGISSKDVRYLNDGDEVTPLFLVYAPKEDSDDIFEITEGESFTISGTPVIEDKTLLGYGHCGYCFQFYGPGETFLGNSQSVIFEIEDEKIVDTILVKDKKTATDDSETDTEISEEIVEENI